MATTTQTQNRYDHRLKELVRSTQDIRCAIQQGVPPSTARGWLRAPTVEVISIDVVQRDAINYKTRSCSFGPGVGRDRKLSSNAPFPTVDCTALRTLSLGDLRSRDFDSRRSVASVRADGVPRRLPKNGSWLIRYIAVAAIIDAAMSVLIPVFHLLSRGEMKALNSGVELTLADIDAEIAQLESRLFKLRQSCMEK
jgi:hypothetical protein